MIEMAPGLRKASSWLRDPMLIHLGRTLGLDEEMGGFFYALR